MLKNSKRVWLKSVLYVPTSYNRTVTASPPYSGSGYTKTQSGYALCAFLFRHIFAVAGIASQFQQPQKRQLQPERYVKCHEIGM
jgi:hypothetical protein